MTTQTIDVTPSAYTFPLLIKHLLHAPQANAPEQEIVYRDRVRYPYRTLRERIGRLASALAALGVRPGTTVAVMDWDSHRYLECFFGVPMMGAVLQTVNIRLSPEQILYTLNHAQADVVLVNREFLPLFVALRDKLTTVRQVVLIDDEGGGTEAGEAAGVELAGEYEALLAAAAPGYAFPDFDENTRATTFYTTGTTGLPKGVYFSHRQLVLHTLMLLAALGMSARQGRMHRDDVYMPITPMFHVHAWGLPYAATLAGLKQVYPGRYAPEMLLQLYASEKVTVSHCVPTIMQMVLGSPAAANIDLRGWKVVIGGSALPTGLARAAIERGIDIFTGYGMSETCPVLTLAQIDTSVLDSGDVEAEIALRTRTGRPVPLVDLRVVDADMNDVPHDGKSTGEVVVRAPWLTQGYLHNPEASEQLWAGGYLHTNDIGHIDASGYLQVTDRMKDVIKTGGEWISSLQLEDIISRHPAVAEVAVIGIPDAKWGERPCALVVPRFGVPPVTADDIRRHVAGHAEKGLISRYAVPDTIEFVEALERTSVGKLNKRTMRQRYGEGAPQQ